MVVFDHLCTGEERTQKKKSAKKNQNTQEIEEEKNEGEFFMAASYDFIQG